MPMPTEALRSAAAALESLAGDLADEPALRSEVQRWLGTLSHVLGATSDDVVDESGPGWFRIDPVIGLPGSRPVDVSAPGLVHWIAEDANETRCGKKFVRVRWSSPEVTLVRHLCWACDAHLKLDAVRPHSWSST